MDSSADREEPEFTLADPVEPAAVQKIPAQAMDQPHEETKSTPPRMSFSIWGELDITIRVPVGKQSRDVYVPSTVYLNVDRGDKNVSGPVSLSSAKVKRLLSLLGVSGE